MDFLQDVLRHCNPDRSSIRRTRFFQPLAWTVPATERLTGFLLITQGRALLRSAEMPSPVTLETGDLLVIVRGCDYELASPGASPTAYRSVLLPPEVPEANVVPLTTLVIGGFRFRDAPMEGGLIELPRQFLVRASEIDTDPQLRDTLRLISGEVDRNNPADGVASRLLLELFCTYAFAHWQQRQAADDRAVKDAYVYRSLRLVHQDVARRWTLGDLVRASGLSRKIFLTRFKTATGTTPLRYITRLRMDRANELLRTTRKPLQQIAFEVGYRDPFGFSKAFKRTKGDSPKFHRRRHNQAT